MPRRKKNAAKVKLPRQRPIGADGRCWLTGKLGYRTLARAEAALAEVRERRLANAAGEVKRLENRVIVPAHVCGMFHLTHLTEEEYIAEQKKWGTGEHAE